MILKNKLKAEEGSAEHAAAAEAIRTCGEGSPTGEDNKSETNSQLQNTYVSIDINDTA